MRLFSPYAPLVIFLLLGCDSERVQSPVVDPGSSGFNGFQSGDLPKDSMEPSYTLLESGSETETNTEPSPGKTITSYNLASIIHFTDPGQSVPSKLATFRVEAASSVARVEYLAKATEGTQVWTLGESSSASNGFAFTYHFEEGGSRTIGARAYGNDNTLLGTAWKGLFVGGNEDPGTPIAEAYDIQFIAPQGNSAQNPVTFLSTTQGNVTKVRYLVDDTAGGSPWVIGESSAEGAGFHLVYSFSQAGIRTLHAQGLNPNNEIVSQDTKTLEVIVASPEPGGNAPNEPSNTDCGSQQVEDCNGSCQNKSWVGDNFCDDGSQYAAVFDCNTFNNDGGDCGEEIPGANPCQAGEVLDCVGNCAKTEWIGDGFCDDGTEYNIVLTCASYENDGGDCAPNEGSGTPPQNNAAGLVGVPYFYQYNNAMFPSATCQNTSIAMVLKYYGWNGVPDSITAVHGKDKAQYPAGLAAVFNDVAEASGIAERLVAITNGTIAGLKGLLTSGQPVIVNGYFTSYGHVLVVTGYANGYYTVNDPAGIWNGVFKATGGYSGSSSSGKGIAYPAGAFETAISSLSGSDYAPLWYYKVVH